MKGLGKGVKRNGRKREKGVMRRMEGIILKK